MSFAFGWRTKKSARYSQESMETITLSTIPSGVMVEQSANYSTVVVFLKEPWRLSLSIVSFVITLMVAPRSIKVCGIMVPLMWTSTIGLLGSRYFGQITYPNIRSESFPMTLMVGASLLHLPGCLKHFSLIKLLQIDTYFMACRSGIFTDKCFNSPRSSVSFGVGWTVADSLSRNGGFSLGSLSFLPSSTSLGGGWLYRTFLDHKLIS